MGDSLEVHHGGLTQAQEALDGQSDEAQVVLDYVRSACADNGAFGRGFLALFQGTYGDAFADMTDTIATGVEGARARAGAMAATLQAYVENDDAVRAVFGTLEPSVGPAGPLAGDGPPTLPGEVKLPGRAADLGFRVPDLVSDPMNTPDRILRGFGDQFTVPGHGTPLSPLELLDQGLTTHERLDGVGEARDDMADMSDFIDEGDDR